MYSYEFYKYGRIKEDTLLVPAVIPQGINTRRIKIYEILLY